MRTHLRDLYLRWVARRGGETALARSLRRIRAVARKEIRQLVRDPFTLGFVVGVPAVRSSCSSATPSTRTCARCPRRWSIPRAPT